jgi:hypothetical protein
LELVLYQSHFDTPQPESILISDIPYHSLLFPSIYNVVY